MLQSFFTQVTIVADTNSHVRKFMFSIGSAVVSSVYSTLSANKGQELASNHLKNYLYGEVPDVCVSDLDGS